MADSLVDKLNLNQKEKTELGKTVSRIKSVTTFLSDAIEAVKGSKLVAAIGAAVPWAQTAGAALGEVVPPVKFAIELFSKLSEEHDPEVLAHLACTLAYQSAIEQTVKAMEAPIVSVKEKDALKKEMAQLEPTTAVDFTTFSFDSALSHEFIQQADIVLEKFAEGVGYSEVQRRQLINGVHFRFVTELKKLLANGELQERYKPFTKFMELGSDERRAYQALRVHAEYQLWQFEEEPVFKKEPFALSHVYVETECGDLSWDEILKASEASSNNQAQKRDRIDLFAERWGKRQSLIEAVMGHIADPTFKDALVIQGVAGSGKSSFTLRLCAELIKEGLSPIRVRLRDLPLDTHVSVRLPQVVPLSDKEAAFTGNVISHPDDLFLEGEIFKQFTNFRGARICPYVLILDGWDEINIAASEGFKIRLAEKLQEVRGTYINPSNQRVRVVLAGRPSDALLESGFMHPETRLLTVRPLRPDQLEAFVKDLSVALTERPIQVNTKASEKWSVPVVAHFKSVLATYEEEYKATTEEFEADQTPPAEKVTARREMTGSMAVLGLPLLAYLAIRLMSQWKGELSELVSNPTTLYRSLVDLTSVKSEVRRGGKDFSVRELRTMLQRTAEAMTIYGQESISYDELALRLEDENIDEKARVLLKEHTLTALVISFFFKGGLRHLGCEFLHKSFREYLFAERIVERLKEYGIKQETALAQRKPYWKDFDSMSGDDFRYDFSRNLATLLAPQWLSRDVASYVEQLLIWEIGRSKDVAADHTPDAENTALGLNGWLRIRDGLADVWDWWAEGVHLRPAQMRNESGVYEAGKIYVQELLKLSTPRDYEKKRKPLEFGRTVTADAHLGDGLFRLCTVVHFQIAANTGWLGPLKSGAAGTVAQLTPAERWAGASESGKGPRRYQTKVTRGDNSWVLFTPSGNNPRYFENYCHRINSAGWRPHGNFPVGTNMSGSDLRQTRIVSSYSSDALTGETIWNYANLSKCNAMGSIFLDQQLTEVLATESSFSLAYIGSVKLSGSDFSGAFLESSMLEWCDAEKTDFSKARLTNAIFTETTLTDSNFESVSLEQADLRKTQWMGVNLKNTNFDYANLEGADLTDALIDETTNLAKAFNYVPPQEEAPETGNQGTAEEGTAP